MVARKRNARRVVDSEVPRSRLKAPPRAAGNGSARADLGPMARVLSVIEAIAFAEEAVGLRQVEEKTGLPKPTVHRILAHLERMGYLQRAMGPKTYFAGSRLAALSLAAVSNRWAHHESHKVLEDLVKRIGETCNITILDGYEGMIVDRVETPWPLRYVMHVNLRFPLHCTASGKLYLSLMPAKRRAWFFRNHTLARNTPNTIIDPRKLEKLFPGMREDGFAIDHEELLPGLVAVAVPLMDDEGRLLGTVAVNAAVARISADQLARFVPLLKQAASTIAKLHRA